MGFLKKAFKGLKKLAGGAASIGTFGLADGLIGGTPELKAPDAPPGAPTIDQAAMQEDQARKLRRRRGRAANILAGDDAGAGAPGTATKTLLGN